VVEGKKPSIDFYSIYIIWKTNIFLLKSHLFFLQSAPLSPVVSKASAGAMEMMNIFQVSHLPSFLRVR
jgi:hypothetical protein